MFTNTALHQAEPPTITYNHQKCKEDVKPWGMSDRSNNQTHSHACMPEQVGRQLGCLKSQGAKLCFSMGIMSYRGHCLMEPRPNNVPLWQMQVRVPGLSPLFSAFRVHHSPVDHSAHTPCLDSRSLPSEFSHPPVDCSVHTPCLGSHRTPQMP